MRAALNQGGDRAQAHYALGLSEQAAGRIDAAIAHFDAALRLRPDFPEASWPNRT
jgi:tetratricopeptide (TPR) repeat protein